MFRYFWLWWVGEIMIRCTWILGVSILRPIAGLVIFAHIWRGSISSITNGKTIIEVKSMNEGKHDLIFGDLYVPKFLQISLTILFDRILPNSECICQTISLSVERIKLSFFTTAQWISHYTIGNPSKFRHQYIYCVKIIKFKRT